jgi:hypothetical protein
VDLSRQHDSHRHVLDIQYNLFRKGFSPVVDCLWTINLAWNALEQRNALNGGHGDFNPRSQSFGSDRVVSPRERGSHEVINVTEKIPKAIVVTRKLQAQRAFSILPYFHRIERQCPQKHYEDQDCQGYRA